MSPDRASGIADLPHFRSGDELISALEFVKRRDVGFELRKFMP